MSTQQSVLERQVWELFCEELGLSPDSDEPLTDEQEAHWQQIRRGSQNKTSNLESVYSETRAPDDDPVRIATLKVLKYWTQDSY
ncbi:hypothetical protein AMATHDRAFT_7981 [Amanita thiersii Skay4041]|uniref:Uncharacterized protein n=1 Tax=Amanita thiersii Skay4041 TaxID=703135 RepID=A0A2A9NF20_9AGAR|nr:hypothetical protein AMATHDRAFT_7981 [Amanita thiersii Skay4041]